VLQHLVLASQADAQVSITANSRIVGFSDGSTQGSTTLTYDAGPKHPYVEIWVKVDDAAPTRVLEDDGDGKGTHTATVEKGKRYVFILTDHAEELATVEVRGMKRFERRPIEPASEPTRPAKRLKKLNSPSAILNAINEIRAANGVEPLQSSPVLRKVTGSYVTLMSEKDKARHDLDGKHGGLRISEAGYAASDWAENVAENWGEKEPGKAGPGMVDELGGASKEHSQR